MIPEAGAENVDDYFGFFQFYLKPKIMDDGCDRMTPQNPLDVVADDIGGPFELLIVHPLSG